MNVLVLENVSDLDKPLVEYLHTLKGDTIKIIYSIQQKNKAVEIQTEMGKCDVLCVCSTFANRDQLRHFAKLIPLFPNIKEVRILYLYTKIHEERQFLNFLNQEIDKELFNDIVKIVKSDNVKIYEIFHREFIAKKQEYFDSTVFYFDIVPLYFNEEYKMLWHVRLPHVVIPGTFLYLDQKYRGETNGFNVVDEPKGINIEEADVKEFKELMKELRATLDYQLESCKLQDFGDSATLIPEKEKYLELLDKYNF